MPKKHALYILRHAKTKKSSGFDYERLLHKRGIRQTHALGSYLKRHDVRIDLIISSEAPRAVETGQIIQSSLSIEGGQLRSDRRLYGTTPNKWLDRLHAVPDTTGSVMIIGHNPELEILTRRLLGFPLIILPPCGLIAIESRCQWKNLGAGKGNLLWSHYPDGYESVRPETSQIAAEMVKAVKRTLPRQLRRREVTAKIKPLIDSAMSDLAAEMNRVTNGNGNGKT